MKVLLENVLQKIAMFGVMSIIVGNFKPWMKMLECYFILTFLKNESIFFYFDYGLMTLYNLDRANSLGERL